MDLESERFASYVDALGSVIGRANRNGPLRDYCTGLILPGERKSVEPIAARTAPALGSGVSSVTASTRTKAALVRLGSRTSWTSSAPR